MVDVAALIKAAKRPERTMQVFLAGDLVVEFEELDRQRAAAEQQGTESLDGGPAVALAQRMEELRSRMADSAVTIRLRALSRLAYDKLFGEHPPRRDDEGEVLPQDLAGFNSDTFYPALIRACWVEPVLEPPVLDQLLDEVLSNWQFDEVAKAAVNINRGRIDVPFSPAASRPLTISGDE
jgi:hypothetical protein